MLETVEVRTNQGGLLLLPLRDSSGGFIVKGIDGLDPVKATLVSSGFAKLPGSDFQSSKKIERNVIFRLKYDPSRSGESVQTLRDRLYEFFMPESHVNLRFVREDGFSVDISGVVETCDAPLFEEDPMATISIMCYDPDFVQVGIETVAGFTVADAQVMEVSYVGTVNTGLEFELLVDRTVSEFTIYHTVNGEITNSLEYAWGVDPLVAGDVLTISTVPRNKGATLVRASSPQSVLFGVSPHSTWHQFKRGVNEVRFHVDGAPIPYNIHYRNRFGGL